ncbi:hypothetical protein CANCADRAFT_97169 [Tortispora caseinolytica NRRL Y-17796]|uniref:Uncharacterized protein n=1 Tax=Tortispora caseinolytica NRRL Y-17796 TaxID=767744 RepID=A0A1E4TDR7_9ASCO|nr:hypothetical protein CANCADRAFT_97169 [Tortispora caseinolytica NRRL Y-17796]
MFQGQSLPGDETFLGLRHSSDSIIHTNTTETEQISLYTATADEPTSPLSLHSISDHAISTARYTPSSLPPSPISLDSFEFPSVHIPESPDVPYEAVTVNADTVPKPIPSSAQVGHQRPCTPPEEARGAFIENFSDNEQENIRHPYQHSGNALDNQENVLPNNQYSDIISSSIVLPLIPSFRVPAVSVHEGNEDSSYEYLNTDICLHEDSSINANDAVSNVDFLRSMYRRSNFERALRLLKVLRTSPKDMTSHDLVYVHDKETYIQEAQSVADKLMDEIENDLQFEAFMNTSTDPHRNQKFPKVVNRLNSDSRSIYTTTSAQLVEVESRRSETYASSHSGLYKTQCFDNCTISDSFAGIFEHDDDLLTEQRLYQEFLDSLLDSNPDQ